MSTSQEDEKRLLERAKYKKELKKAKRNADLEKTEELQMTSLMDIFVNVLIYLLMNYSTSPIDAQPSKQRTIPKSLAKADVKHSVSIGVTRSKILVNRKPVCDLTDSGFVDPQYKKDKKPNAFLIVPLLKALKAAATKAKKLQQMGSKTKFDGTVTIVADYKMKFRLLSEVMYTAGQAEFGKYKFAVIKGRKGFNDPFVSKR